MATLKIIYNNVTDKAAITASSTAGSLVPANMQNDRKSKVWRSTSTSGSIYCIWSESQFINGVTIPFCNLTSAAVITVKIYTETVDSIPIYTSPPTLVAPATALGSWIWGSQPLGVNAYSYGFNTYGRIWLPSIYVGKKMILEIEDSTNPAGYIEIGRLVSGTAWQPTYNTGFGIPITFEETSVHDRSESGDLVTTIGTRFKRLSFDLNWMNATDVAQFNDIVRLNGMTKPIYVSLFPNDPDPDKEQTYQIYGKLTQIPQLSHPMHTIYSAQIEMEEI